MDELLQMPFGEEFLAHLRARTESAWAHLPTIDDVDGWQPGTLWTRPYTDAEFEAIEHSTGVRFPPDLRLFYARLGTTTPPTVLFVEDEHRQLHRVEEPGFYDWRDDDADIAALREGVVQRLWWPRAWGQAPRRDEQTRVIREGVAQAPRLLPLCGNRYVVGDPEVAGNPVLSIHGSDHVVIADTLRDYLVNHFSRLLGLLTHDNEWPLPTRVTGAALPFWGAFLLDQETRAAEAHVAASLRHARVDIGNGVDLAQWEERLASAVEHWIVTLLNADSDWPLRGRWSDGLFFERCDVDDRGATISGSIVNVASQGRVGFQATLRAHGFGLAYTVFVQNEVAEHAWRGVEPWGVAHAYVFRHEAPE